jgi:hypothetical protein
VRGHSAIPHRTPKLKKFNHLKTQKTNGTPQVMSEASSPEREAQTPQSLLRKDYA